MQERHEANLIEILWFNDFPEIRVYELLFISKGD
jgi:hypothetical protein